MPAIIVPRKWEKQPQRLVEVDWDMDAVEFVFHPLIGLITKKGIVSPTTGAISRIATKYELAHNENALIFPITPIVNNTDYTFLGITQNIGGPYRRIFGLNTGTIPLDLATDSTTGTYIEHSGIWFPAEPTLASRPDKIAFVHEASGPCRIVSDTTVSDDGNTSSTASFSQLRILSGYGQCATVLGFRKALSVERCRHYLSNPNSIFQPRREVLYFSTGSVTIPTLSSPGVTNILTTSATPQVTLTF